MQDPYLNSVLEAIAADARDPDGPRLISVDELRAAGALDVPPAWRKSLGADCDAFAANDEVTMPLFGVSSRAASNDSPSAVSPRRAAPLLVRRDGETDVLHQPAGPHDRRLRLAHSHHPAAHTQSRIPAPRPKISSPAAPLRPRSPDPWIPWSLALTSRSSTPILTQLRPATAPLPLAL